MRSWVLIAQHREGDEGEAKDDQGGEKSGLIGARLKKNGRLSGGHTLPDRGQLFAQLVLKHVQRPAQKIMTSLAGGLSNYSQASLNKFEGSLEVIK